ncbi:MAG TPA: serine hydrolase [Pyrinomonadaceae bacterium]|jgi:CubicO group peptidase (beta-lactamase class C family)
MACPRTRISTARVARAAALAALLSACCAAARLTPVAAAQQDPTLNRLLELNRSGEWDEAARLAQDFLTKGAQKPPAQRCEALYDLAYSQTRLGMSAEALGALASFDKECGNLPAHLAWVKAEAAKLRSELSSRRPAATPAQTTTTPARDDGFWQTADPAALGLNVEALKRHAELCARTGADACLVVYKGKIVQELYGARYRTPMMAMSSTKSVTGLLVGALIDEGKIKSADEPVCKYVAEWCAGAKGKVTLRHLLTMTSGLPRLSDKSVGWVGDKNRFVIDLPLATEPGSAWAYSNEGVQLLSPVIDRAAGEPAQDYARRRLFQPLGMNATRLHLDDKGHAWTYADMETTPRDFARLGLLMLNRGTWRGARVLSESWVEQSTRPSQTLHPGYGLLWWLIDSPPGYAALGHLDTNLYVFPAPELIVVRMQSKPLAPQPPYQPEALAIFKQLTGK